MRVTAGRFGGRALAAPGDARVRPTSDKVRQAVFNILAHKDFSVGFALEGARAIDLFAGTGAMGIEALSRGSRYCLFIDDHAESRALIRQNVEVFGLTGITKIWRRDATDLGPNSMNESFDLAFLDPPYRKNLVPLALTSLHDGGWLSPNAIIVTETAEDEIIPPTDGFTLLEDRVYGDTRATIMRANRQASPA